MQPWRPTARLLLSCRALKQAILGIFLAVAALGCSHSSSSEESLVAPATGPTPMTLRVSGDTELSRKGETVQLSAFVAFSDGATVDKTGSAGWVSQNPGVATVSSTGILTAVEDGSSVITATFQNIAGSMTVIVDLPVAPPH
jgi:trimeric autotransporter adhesin